MFEEIINIVPADGSGDLLYIEMQKLRDQFAYCGLWFARDRSEESIVTTTLFYSDRGLLPGEPSEELKENSFMQAPRFMIQPGHNHVWMGARISDTGYGKLRLSDFKKESAYLNIKVIHNRASGADVLGSAIIRGGEAYFARVGIEDMLGAADYEDTTLYLVLIKDPPPRDWGAADYLGVEGLPVQVPPCRFTVDGKYSGWLGQNPLDGINR
jgi:hypothetical protein